MVTNSDYNYKSETIKVISKMRNSIILARLYYFVKAIYQKEMGIN